MKRKIWLPLLTIGATTAVVVPAITSCRPGLMGTHDMLNPDYIHHVLPESERTIIGKSIAVEQYFKSVQNNSDVLKDDLLYTYSKILTTDTYKANLDFDFTRYFLYVDDIVADYDKGTIDFVLWAEITGTTKQAKLEDHKYDGKYLRDFTLVIGAKISTPCDSFDMIEKKTTEPFNGAFEFKFERSLIAYRTYILGTVGLSDTTTSAITQKQIDVDESAKYSSDPTQNIQLYNDLVYSIPSKGLYGSNTKGEIYIESYYFKNIKFTA